MNIKFILIDNYSYLDSLVELSKNLFNQSSKYNLNDFKDAIDHDNYVIYGLLDDEKLIGYIYYLKSLDEGEIYQLGIKKEYQNNKLGELLLSKSLLELKKEGIKNIFLEVRDNNNQAINLYKKVGFKQISIRKKYYDNNIDALIYKKEI